MRVAVILMLVSYVYGGPATESYKDQYCTDPRTMKKHAAYTEWADAYSCTRHRCQPGGRNLAIYTVGCKRVEAPESAIECEEVVEDTNMQFPYCCTRLRDARVDLNFVPVDDMIFGLVGTDFQYISRCLVVVRGEVWTRVLGQPWEVLPAAPWSHMYKMKKPPPGDTTFLSKTPEQGPVYELAEPEKQTPREKVLRASKDTTEAPDCNEVVPRAVPAPDIVIALSTSNDKKERKKKEHPRHKRVRKTSQISSTIFNDEHDNQELSDGDDTTSATEKSSEPHSGERFRGGAFGVTQRVPKVQHHQVAWTEIPQNEWHEHETPVDPETPKDTQDSPVQDNEKKEEKPSNLQALVDAIGTRMRDIEHVVQRMSEKVHHEKPADTEATSAEKRSSTETRNHHKDGNKEMGKAKKPSPDAENYKRFSVRNRGSKYVHGTSDSTTEQPLFVEDTNMNGYFSDASNSVLRRVNPPKEPAGVYMAPVETRRKTPAHILVSDSSDEGDKKRKKHTHKKKRGKGHTHRKHHKDDKRKHFNKLTSVEIDKNAVSLEDSSAVASK